MIKTVIILFAHRELQSCYFSVNRFTMYVFAEPESQPHRSKVKRPVPEGFTAPNISATDSYRCSKLDII